MPTVESKMIEIAAEEEHDTPDALLLNDGSKKAWVPRRLVTDNDDGTYTMPEWLARNKGFI